MDLDFDTIISDVLALTAYESGHGALLTSDGIVVCHSILEEGTDIRDLGEGLDVVADKLSQDSSESEIYEYKFGDEKRELAFRALRNGMRFILAVPYEEIDAARTQTLKQHAIMLVIALALFTAFAVLGANSLTRPLIKLTEAAHGIETGQSDIEFPKVTHDEIGVLNQTMQMMSASINDLVSGLSSKAYRDALTGVRNKGSFLDDTNDLNKGEEPFAIVVFDVNNLKKVNDQYGHERGDIYLKKNCSLICDVFRHCPVYRVGGDEFVAVLKGRNIELADTLIAEMDSRSAENNASVSDMWENVDCARGIAYYSPEDGMAASGNIPETSGASEEGETLVDRIFNQADANMYEHKVSGKKAR